MSETVARIRTNQSAHFYHRDGRPCFEVPYADPSKGMRKATLADARKLKLLPSPTTILKVLHKQGLVEWMIEQACLAVLTSPRNDGESLDDFVHRILKVEMEQDGEAKQAAELGTKIHAAIALELNGNPRCYPSELEAYVLPAVESINEIGLVVGVERVLIGERYCGTTDVICEKTSRMHPSLLHRTVVDTKTTKTLPTKDSWWEHQLQTAAYAKACGASRTANVYVSTSEPGKVAVFVQEDSEPAWQAFKHLLDYWYITNKL